MTVLAGIHTGCMELRVNDSIKSVADLRGKKVGINTVGDAGQLLVGAMAAYVGLDPVNEIEWIVNPTASQPDLFTNGEIDAFIGFPPDPTQPCALDAGHVIVNIGSDAPWSRYFCCMATANADFVRNNPVATKRALRAILKATDICHEQPDVAVQRVVEKIGFSHECAHMHLHHADYSHWRDYDPEDAVRFYALRLQEVGMIKKSPNEIISNFTDWRFLEEIKKELA
jgi:NitT/TauT family transport system substrate-binding protein